MSHFPESNWVDSVRGVLPPEQHSRLQQHLDQECLACTTVFRFWDSLADLLAQQRRYKVPEELLQAVEKRYLEQKPWQWLRTAARWAENVFDSFEQPAVALVRGTAQADRHLVYESSPFVIDITLRTDVRQNSLSIIGQVLKSENPENGTDEVHVVLLSGDDIAAKALASEGGEFSLACEVHPDLNLFISIRGERAIGISLSETTNGKRSLF